jgi:hypothetical protein
MSRSGRPIQIDPAKLNRARNRETGGEREACDETLRARLLSSYTTEEGVRFWIITEAGFATCEEWEASHGSLNADVRPVPRR